MCTPIQTKQHEPDQTSRQHEPDQTGRQHEPDQNFRQYSMEYWRKSEPDPHEAGPDFCFGNHDFGQLRCLKSNTDFRQYSMEYWRKQLFPDVVAENSYFVAEATVGQQPLRTSVFANIPWNIGELPCWNSNMGVRQNFRWRLPKIRAEQLT